jgi:type VI secretion system protein VasG
VTERAEKVAELESLQARFEQEKALVGDMQEIRGQIEDAANTGDKDAMRARLTETTGKLHALQGEEPLIHPVVDGQAVGEVVAGWTGIPTGRMQSNEIRTILHLKETMEERIVGQSHALEAVAEAIRTSRAGLTDPRKPIGVFLMVGTSGTGKTADARRPAVWRRAEYDDHQYVGVQGGA